jgi:hypothetical protein
MTSIHPHQYRDPFDMIISWTAKNGVHREGCTLDATSLPHMVHLYSEIRSATGTSPIVVDSSLLKIRPKEVLAELCRRLEIPFFEEQLSWPIGPKPDIDGYNNNMRNVHVSQALYHSKDRDIVTMSTFFL